MTAVRSYAFDTLHAVQTAQPMSLAGLTTRRDLTDAVEYQPTDLGLAREALKALRVDHRRFTFIDLGSGKGRVLCLASHYPFREIIGVEFAHELHVTASENVRRYRAWRRRCWQLVTVWEDATAYEFPSGSLVVYLFNPFRAPIMRHILDNLERSMDAEPRDIYIVAVSWARDHLKDRSRIEVLQRHVGFSVCRLT